jgi:ribosomal protein L21E
MMMDTFKVGDRVKVITIRVDPEYTSKDLIGKVGVITDTTAFLVECPIGVKLDGNNFRSFFAADELEKVS